MDPIVYLIIVIICIILSAFFSSSETALLRISKDQIERDLEGQGQLSVIAAKELIKTPAKLLVTILLGNNIANILGAACASALGAYYLGEKEGLVISTAIMTVVVLIFSEILPKSVAAKNPTKIGYFCSLPLYMLHKLCTPIHFVYAWAIEPLVKKIAGGKVSTEAALSVAESILKMAEKIEVKKNDGTPLPIMSSAARAAGLICRDIMIPRFEIFSFPVGIDPKEAERKLADSRFTRALIYEKSLDTVVGFIHLKDLVRMNNKEEVGIVKDIVKPVLQIPAKMSILALWPKMQKSFVNIAVVTDAGGHTEGMITQEDILEEIVGEIRDEFDHDELKRIRKKAPHRFEVLGNVSLHDFNKETLWDLEGAKGENICELLYNHLEHPPESGDKVEIGNFLLRVKDVSGKRVTRVEISKMSQ